MAGMHLFIDSRIQVPLLGRLLAALAACVLWAGICGGAVAACGVELPVEAIAAACVCGIAVAVAGGFLAGRGKSERIFYGVVAGALVVMCVILHVSFAAGGAHFANGLIMSIGERTQEYALPFETGTTGDLVFFCSALSAAIALACSLMAQQGNVLPAVLIGAAALVAIIMGWVPFGWWAPVLALGALMMAGNRTTRAGTAAERPSIAWTIIGVAAICAIALGGTALAMRTDTADVGGAQSALDRMLWSARYGNATFAMPEGDLRNVGDLKASDQAAITVKTDHPTFEYLRGFVGERYEDNQWKPLDASDVMDARSTFYWLDRDGFSGSSQLARAAELSKYDGAEDASLEIDLHNVRGDYAYLPYGYESGAAAHATTDMAQTRRDGSAAQTVAYGSQLARRAYLLQDALYNAQSSAGKNGTAAATGNAADLRLYLDDESAYKEFAQSAYLDIPDNVREVFQKLYGPPVKLTTEQAKIQVQYHLDDTVAYADGTEEKSENAPTAMSQQSEAPDGSMDFVEDFLTETRSGYSVHYATAAALMLRYYGIPARYVEGYVLNTAQLDATNKDAERAAHTEKGLYTLTERQAHAWVEYYLDGVGWLPFDITPGWRAGGYYETTAKTELINESQNWSVGEADASAVWNPPEPEKQEEDEPEAPFFNGPLLFVFVEWPWALLGFVLTLLIAIIIRDALLHARLARLLAQATDEDADPAKAVPALFSYAILLLRECGHIPLQNKPYTEQGRLVSQAGFCSADAFERAAAANDRALFGAAGPTGRDASLDINAVAGCVNQVLLGIREQVSPLRRFWQRHVRCLW